MGQTLHPYPTEFPYRIWERGGGWCFWNGPVKPQIPLIRCGKNPRLHCLCQSAQEELKGGEQSFKFPTILPWKQQRAGYITLPPPFHSDEMQSVVARVNKERQASFWGFQLPECITSGRLVFQAWCSQREGEGTTAHWSLGKEEARVRTALREERGIGTWAEENYWTLHQSPILFRAKHLFALKHWHPIRHSCSKKIECTYL